MFFCLAGIAGHYFLISMAYFWFFHVCSTFYKVMFPHLAKRTEGKQGFIHAVLALLGQWPKTDFIHSLMYYVFSLAIFYSFLKGKISVLQAFISHSDRPVRSIETRHAGMRKNATKRKKEDR